MSARMRLRALVIGATCSLVAVLAVALPSAQAPAQAADLGAFEAGNIISDALFYDSGTMSASAVQSFLTQKGSACAATTGRTCLKNFRQTTLARPSDVYCTRAYAGAINETAAQIIAKVAGSCGINPQVLLVMLQKEQGLVTAAAGGSVAGYRSAMGYGCPDTAACDTKYYGFFNQVYSAAHRFRYYAKYPLGYAHRAGMVNQVRYHPNAACGTSPVYIQNQATASLYNYTPYQPNAAALAAGYGTGNSCSAYGNRNFWNYFTDWFGPTTQRAPIGSLDSATGAPPGMITVSGWALDPDTTSSIRVHVYIDGLATASLAATGSRLDVGRIYRRGNNHGFNVSITAPIGNHQVCVYAIDSAGRGNSLLGCKDAAVINHSPIGVLDAVTSTSPGVIAVRGWVLDPDTTASIRVHVYVDGHATTSLAATGLRPDVGRIFGKGDNHGFTGTLVAAAGPRQVCIYAINTPAGPNPLIACKNVVVSNRAPLGALDFVTPGMDSFTVRGWALDPNTSPPINVHVYVDGVATASITANTSRPDVGRIYAVGNNHGFMSTIKASYGAHQVCVYAIDSWGGVNSQIRCATVNVNATAIGALDSAIASPGKITVRGWALDPNTTSSIRVHVYVGGVAAMSLAATGPRPDVGRIFGKGDNHGFTGTVTVAPGLRQVCIYAIDSSGGTNPRVGCKNVTVP